MSYTVQILLPLTYRASQSNYETLNNKSSICKVIPYIVMLVFADSNGLVCICLWMHISVACF